MRTIAALLAFSLATSPISLLAQDAADNLMAEKIRAEGMRNSKVVEIFDHLVTVIGPRLTNSPAHRKAAAWMEEALKGYGLANVHTEGWKFGRGWTLDRISVEMVEPRYMPLIGYAKGWSPSTAGRIVAAPVLLPGLPADGLKAQAGKLKGAILMTSPMQGYAIRDDRAPASGDLKPPQPVPARPPQLTSELLATLKSEGVAVTLEPNIGEHGTVFVTGRDTGANAVPSVVLASEHYNLIARMLRAGQQVKLAIDVQATFDEKDQNALNVIADVSGTDPALKDEIVMVGAHLDSWHTGTGATDNADGVSTAVEALRLLKALGVKPRRTVRVALWGGEEQGLLGSKAYVEKHLAGDANKAERERFSVYFNLDNGYPPITGFYMEGNEPARKIMEAWLKPFADLGAIMPTPGHIGATDHLSFLAVGLPGFQAVQSYVNYDVRTHHTNMDTAERLDLNALKQASVVMASVLYHAAMRDGKFPRPAATPPTSQQ